MTTPSPVPLGAALFQAWTTFALALHAAQVRAVCHSAERGAQLLSSARHRDPGALALVARQLGHHAARAQHQAARKTVEACGTFVRDNYHALVRAHLLERSLLQSHAVEKAVLAGQASALNAVDRTARLLAG